MKERWFDPALDDSRWLSLVARSAAEGKIWNSFDGWGWYRRKLKVPAAWRGRCIRIVFDSVDDMYELYVNGRLAGGYGRMDRSASSFLVIGEPGGYRPSKSIWVILS